MEQVNIEAKYLIRNRIYNKFNIQIKQNRNRKEKTEIVCQIG